MNYLNLSLKSIFLFLVFYSFNSNSIYTSSDEIQDDIKDGLVNSQKIKPQKAIVPIIKKTSNPSCLKTCLPYTISHVFVVVATLAACYYAYSRLLEGCGQIESGCKQMQESCNNCISDLNTAKNSLVGFQNFTNKLMSILNNCPAGRMDIIEGFYKLDNDCCKK